MLVLPLETQSSAWLRISPPGNKSKAVPKQQDSWISFQPGKRWSATFNSWDSLPGCVEVVLFHCLPTASKQSSLVRPSQVLAQLHPALAQGVSVSKGFFTP